MNPHGLEVAGSAQQFCHKYNLCFPRGVPFYKSFLGRKVIRGTTFVILISRGIGLRALSCFGPWPCQSADGFWLFRPKPHTVQCNLWLIRPRLHALGPAKANPNGRLNYWILEAQGLCHGYRSRSMPWGIGCKACSFCKCAGRQVCEICSVHARRAAERKFFTSTREARFIRMR